MHSPDAPHQNRLLAALPTDIYARLHSHLALVSLQLGQVLHESDSQLRHVFFPATAIVSLLHITQEGASAEIAMIGNEGMVGVTLFLGGETSPSRAVVQSSGIAYRLKAQVLHDEFSRAGGRRSCTMQNLLLRYTMALLTQTAQTAVCNRHHSVDQQLCRCLLLCLDRMHSNELVMTQELIANMIGVRREGITEAAGKLQHAGLIEYHRGHITVINRPGLEARSCECYKVVKKEFNRLLPEIIIPDSHTSPAAARDVMLAGHSAQQAFIH